MLRRLASHLVLGLVIILFANGCGSDTATIDGQVTVDGKPLEKGSITFAPAEPNSGTVPAIAEIRDGHYHVKTTPGRKIVMLSAPRVVRHKPAHVGPAAPMVEVTAESLPESYNVKSQLQFEANRGGNTKDWSAESMPLTPATP